jgi:uncharacterized membrane protein
MTVCPTQYWLHVLMSLIFMNSAALAWLLLKSAQADVNDGPLTDAPVLT